MGTPTWLS